MARALAGPQVPPWSPVIGLMANFLTTPPGLLPKLGSPSTHPQPQQVLSFKGNISEIRDLPTSSPDVEMIKLELVIVDISVQFTGVSVSSKKLVSGG